jgi:uncharacterized coiled-coil DUF342 family protein
LKQESQSRYSIGIRWKQRADTLSAEAKTRTETITELTTKVEEIGKELEGAKTKIGELEKKVAEPQNASAGAEASAPVAAADSAELVSLCRCRLGVGC